MNGREFLHLLAGAERDPYFELEVWDAFGPSRLILDHADASRELADRSQTVYVAPTVRAEPDGEPIAWALIAEPDGPSAINAAAYLAPPTIVHEYGDGTVLALWSLRERLEGDDLARANRSLAFVLGVDPERDLLRAPATTLTTCDPPGAVLSPSGRVYAPSDLPLFEVGASTVPRNTRRVAQLSAKRGDDPLREIPTETYVRVLAGAELPTCPLHAPAQATLHADELAGKPTGFYCSLCAREGSIYDFAAHLWGWSSPSDLTGRRFFELQRTLLAVFADHYGAKAA